MCYIKKSPKQILIVEMPVWHLEQCPHTNVQNSIDIQDSNCITRSYKNDSLRLNVTRLRTEQGQPGSSDSCRSILENVIKICQTEPPTTDIVLTKGYQCLLCYLTMVTCGAS